VEAISKRKSIRAFKSDPVPVDTLKQLMKLALRAPSWGNTQPWEFVIVSGKELEEIRSGFVENAEDALNPDIDRPQQYPESYAARYRAMAAKFLEVRGIQREDRIGRGWWQSTPLVALGCTKANSQSRNGRAPPMNG
jgi:nitroreductase